MTLKLSGVRIDRVYDCGVTGLHRILSEAATRGHGVRHCLRGDGRGPPGRLGGSRRRAGGGRADERWLRREPWRRVRATHHAQQLQPGDGRREHRQRVWGGGPGNEVPEFEEGGMRGGVVSRRGVTTMSPVTLMVQSLRPSFVDNSNS